MRFWAGGLRGRSRVCEESKYDAIRNGSKEDLMVMIKSCIRSSFILQPDGSFNPWKGNCEIDQSIVVELNEERIIAVDVDKRELLRLEGVDLGEMEHNIVLDLTVDGDRWEGDVLGKQPCGWGVLYDREGRIAYEGFRIGRRSVCYGRRYYPEIGVVDYDGEWCDGLRWGRGVQYSRKGIILIDDEWINDTQTEKRIETIPENDRGLVSHSLIEELIVSTGCCNSEEWHILDLCVLKSLKSLSIGDDCFVNVDVLRLIGLSELESVVIGTNSFTEFKNTWLIPSNPNRHFYLKNCPNLKSLKIGRYSFSDYRVCVIENVDALEVIEMGDLNEESCSFHYASLELKSILTHIK